MQLEQLQIHIFGGTSDAITLCQLLDKNHIHYSLSVATSAGEMLAAKVKGSVITGRMTTEQMQQWLVTQKINLVVDATHPFATEVSHNIMIACSTHSINYVRFERPVEVETCDNPLIINVDSVHQACILANTLGKRVFLTTGSKQLIEYVNLLIDKQIIARVLPTVDVIENCYKLGLGVADIIAMKGPFSHEMNIALYQTYQPDVVITKESGYAGGFQHKITACVALQIPCIVIHRPRIVYPYKVFSLDDVLAYIQQTAHQKITHGE